MDKQLYALSGYAEWFWLIARGWKDIENRDWPLSKFVKLIGRPPVRIYLHASKTPASRDEKSFIFSKLTKEQESQYYGINWDNYRGAIIGSTTITDQVTQSKSIWFFGKYGFVCRDSILYTKPTPYKGMLGFFRVDVNDPTR
jgi:hypothetical protein